MCLLAIIGTVTSAIGAYQQAAAQKAQAEYQAQVARNNQVIAAQNERDIIQRGQVAKDVQRTRIQQTIGSARAALSGQGLLVDDTQGSTAEKLQDDLRVAGTLDIMTLKSNIDREASRARIQGAQFAAEAGLYDLKASSINPMLASASAGFSTFASVYDMFGGGQSTKLGSTITSDLIGAG